MKKHHISVASKTGNALILIGLMLLIAFLPGCATLDKFFNMVGLGDKDSAASAEGLAMDAIDEFNHGKYASAFEDFEDLKDRFPFSQYSLLAELKMADSKYYMKEYDEAAVLYEEFENNHPTNEAIPYVMFQLGMCHYRQIDTIDRDPAGAFDSIQAFSRLLQAYPDTAYTIETRARIAAAQNFLAHHEFYVADFYLRKEEYKQAEGRLEYIVDNFPNTGVAPQAKELLIAVRSDNPPKRTWRDWVPEISMPDWKTFTDSMSFSKGDVAP